MKFFKDNQMLISLLVGVFLVVVVLAVFTTARNIPDFPKSTSRAYYDVPKAELPAPVASQQDLLKKPMSTGFIDPIYRERLLAERGGVPLPTDILPGATTIPGVDDKFQNLGRPIIKGYGPVPLDSYDELYKKDSPYKLIGRPGRLGVLMQQIMNPDKERLNQLGYNEEGYYESPEDSQESTDFIPQGSIYVREEDPSKFGSALAKLLFTLETAKKASQEKESAPVEGKPEKVESEKEKKKEEENKKK